MNDINEEVEESQQEEAGTRHHQDEGEGPGTGEEACEGEIRCLLKHSDSRHQRRNTVVARY